MADMAIYHHFGSQVLTSKIGVVPSHTPPSGAFTILRTTNAASARASVMIFWLNVHKSQNKVAFGQKKKRRRRITL